MALHSREGTQAFCSAHRQYAYELIWKPEKNYIPGTEVDLRAGFFRQHIEWKLHYAAMEKAEMLFGPHASKVGPEVLQNRKHGIVLRGKLLQMIRRGEPIAIKLTATASLFSGMDLELFLWVREPQEAKDTESPPFLQEEHSYCKLTVQAGPVERLSVYSRPAPGLTGKVKTVIVPEDRYGNPSTFANPVEAVWTWRGEESAGPLLETKTIELPAAEQVERMTVRVRMDALSIHENIANGLVDGEYLVVKGNPVVPCASRGLYPAFGDFHWHTQEVSRADGGRSMTDAFASARDALNMDFAAPSDHDPEGAEWERTVEIVDAFNEADVFATFYGWENSTNRGHENYYFTNLEHAPIRGDSTGFKPADLEAATALLDMRGDFIAVPHHTNSAATLKKAGVPAWHPYNWSEPREYRRLVEIVQNRGNQERNDYPDAWRGLVHNHHASVQDALSMGHRLGFTGGTDNHVGWPGRVIYENRRSVILTGIWTERVERLCVFNALIERRTWAVCDTRAIVWFAVNGTLMGGDLEAAVGEALAAHIRIEAESPLQSVEIVSEGRTVWATSSSSPGVDVQVPLGASRESTHFYVRALQRDGGFMYASPVYVRVGKAGSAHAESQTERGLAADR